MDGCYTTGAAPFFVASAALACVNSVVSVVVTRHFLHLLTFSATAATCISAIDAIKFQRPHTGDQVLVIAVGVGGVGGGGS